MKITRTFIGLALGMAVIAIGQSSFGKDAEKATSTEKTFIMKAANGGMTEVDLGKIAAEKGQMQEVKDFGNRMVTDHSKANDELKGVASSLGVSVPAKVDAKHQATIDKFSKMAAGDAFDKAYVKNMVKDHEEDISEFEKAEKEVKNADLKSFIEKTVPIMKEHLEMVKKIADKKS